MGSESLALRKQLESALYAYVKDHDALPTSTALRRTVNTMFADELDRPVKYIQCRKFVKKRIAAGQYKIDSILAGKGQIVKVEEVSNNKHDEQKENEKEETTGNLMKDAVIEATKQAIKEQQQKIDDATPSQEKRLVQSL